MKNIITLTMIALLATGCQTRPTDSMANNTVVSSGINGVYSGGAYAENQNAALGSTYSSGEGDSIIIRPESSGNYNNTSAQTNTNDASTGDYYNNPSYGQNVIGGPQAHGKDRVLYFSYDSSDIDSRAKAIINQHSAYLKQNPNARILLEGHTDSRGSREYNIALGERRSISVLELFKSKGVPMSQIGVISYGEEKPAIRGFTEKAYQKNRRAIITY